MKLKKPIQNLFQQLEEALSEITDIQYSQPIEALSCATIGQHLRHVIELFMELNKGYSCGTINYELRKRDFRIETNRTFAIAALTEILNSIDKVDKPLMLVCDYSIEDEDTISIITTYNRELIYNIEHAVHHMALIKVGLNLISDLKLPAEFGVAASTLRYRQIPA
mgnify:CR=1 FL=1